MDRPTILEEGHHIDPLRSPLVPHRSKLPNYLYIFSFAPPVPPISRPKEFFDHPIVLYSIGTIAALASGVGLPAFDIVTGVWTDGITADGASDADIVGAGSQAGWIMTLVGVIFFGTFGTFLYCFTVAATKMSNMLREQYLSSIVVQDQAFFDRIGPGEIVTRASKDIDSVRTGLGERLGYLVWSFSSIVAAFVSAFVHAPKLAGVLFALIPFTFIMFTGLGYWAEAVAVTKGPMDGKTSSFIEQILSSVRIVQSFDMAPKLLRKLQTGMLGPLKKLSTKTSATRALEQAAAYGAGFLVYSLSFWYGGISVQGGLSVGNFLTTFYNFVNLFFVFASVVPHYIATSTAIQNLAGLRLQIEREPPIDIRDQSGLRLDEKGGWKPSFELDQVTFAYPSRPAHKALNRVTVNIEPAKFTAFVGPSGSGKSTLASLLMRLYDPLTATKISETDQKIMDALEENDKKEKKGFKKIADEVKDKNFDEVVDGSGIVRFAGHDVTSLNLSWLRHQVAVVQQNPQLVSGSVFDNVAIGLTGTELEYRADIEGASDAPADMKVRLDKITTMVVEALKKAQAWDFVEDLPEGLKTEVAGGRTGVLSGGQVQRVALARALVREPRCLLLDEATSAVSADTELKIQESLLEEQKRRGMTLIVIAHRLSTIVSADKIVVMTNGSIAHSGTYEELLDPACPDQTFRNMALAIPQTNPASRSASSLTLNLPGTQHVQTSDEKAMAAAVDDSDIPPPMTSVKHAFKNVKVLLTVGIVLGLGVGAAFVVAAWLHGRAVAALNNPDSSAMRTQVDRWALWFLVLAIIAFVLDSIHVFGLEASGESLVSQFRFEAVRHLVKQDIAYFEQKATGFGNLTAQATYHPSNVGSVVGVVLAQFISSASNLVATTIMAFILTWRLAVIVLPALFMTLLLGYANFRFLTIFEDHLSSERDKQANFVAESANSIQLNASLTREGEVVRQFKLNYTSRPFKRGMLCASSFTLGGTQAMVQLFGALIFYWGALNVARGDVELADLFTVIESVVIAIYIGAKILTYSGDFTRMYMSLKAIQGWMDRQPQIDSLVEEKGTESATLEKDSDGITLHNVELRYPSRPGVLSLAGVSIHMERGKSYAFCGTSGAGKSSILAVLQRFYNITSGSITLDGKDIRAMDVKEYRNMMGYVSQEPVLFEETIRWNLLAGAINPETITQADMEHACEQARILDFIKTLPEGFETDIGLKGGQLSGGQRQRICIARALLRKPRILLLDEATSALDGESEAHVQQALDNASKGRLTITVGHRLSSIKGADVIFVMDQGQVVDQGRHEELLERKGKYFELVQAQL